MAGNRNTQTAADDDDTDIVAPNEQTGDTVVLPDDTGAAPQNQQAVVPAHRPQDDEVVPDYDIVVDDETGADQGAAEPDDTQAPAPTDRRRPEPQQPGAHESRSSRRARQRQAKERTTAELSRAYGVIDELSRRLDEVQQQYGTVEPRIAELTEANIRSQREGLEAKQAEAERTHNRLDDEYWNAVDSGDTARARQIDRDRQNAFVTKTKLGIAIENFDNIVKERQSRAPAGRDDADPRQTRQTDQRPTPQRQQQPPAVSPVATRLAKDFIDTDAPWYNAPGAELDSNILGAIEMSVGNSGLSPETEEFWDKVYDLAAERIPHRFPAEDGARQPSNRQAAPRPQAQRQAPPVRRGPPTGTPGSARPASGNKNVFRLTPERAKAAFQAGYIDENNRPIDKAKFYQVASQWAAEDREAQRNGR